MKHNSLFFDVRASIDEVAAAQSPLRVRDLVGRDAHTPHTAEGRHEGLIWGDPVDGGGAASPVVAYLTPADLEVSDAIERAEDLSDEAFDPTADYPFAEDDDLVFAKCTWCGEVHWTEMRWAR